jgi:hypothetical protein
MEAGWTERSEFRHHPTTPELTMFVPAYETLHHALT